METENNSDKWERKWNDEMMNEMKQQVLHMSRVFGAGRQK